MNQIASLLINIMDSDVQIIWKHSLLGKHSWFIQWLNYQTLERPKVCTNYFGKAAVMIGAPNRDIEIQ